MTIRMLSFVTSIATLSMLASAAYAQIPPPKDPADMLSEAYTGKSCSPYAGRNFPTFPLWGDSHLHTGNSFDAGAFGATLTPENAYQFARGDEVTSSGGIPIKLSRPLDWLVVSDHSDNVGFFPDLKAGNPAILSNPTGKDWYKRIMAGEGVGVAYEMIGLFANGNFPAELTYWPDTPQFKSVWQRNIVNAATANFTNTIGASELATVWADPDFDPGQRAFYYARVIEIPTPRWSTFEALRFDLPIPEGAPISTQERAYTSPIWYTP